MDRKVFEITVNKHPGVMSHVAGLCSRRGFNVEGILCGPVEGGRKSRMYLLVEGGGRMRHLLRQLEKLRDVIEARESRNCDGTVFGSIDEIAAGCRRGGK